MKWWVFQGKWLGRASLQEVTSGKRPEWSENIEGILFQMKATATAKLLRHEQISCVWGAMQVPVMWLEWNESWIVYVLGVHWFQVYRVRDFYTPCILINQMSFWINMFFVFSIVLDFKMGDLESSYCSLG